MRRSRRRRRLLSLLALAGALVVLAGCGRSGEAEPATPPATEAPPASDAPPGPQPPTDSAPGLADHRHFGYIRALDATTTPATISFDVADFFVGEEVARAMIEDEALAEGDAPIDYYIRNPDPFVLKLPVAANVAVTSVQCPGACKFDIPGDFAGLAASFSSDQVTSLADEYSGTQTQYWVTISGGLVVAIDEQYLP